jgi:hypothetical protein
MSIHQGTRQSIPATHHGNGEIKKEGTPAATVWRFVDGEFEGPWRSTEKQANLDELGIKADVERDIKKQEADNA